MAKPDQQTTHFGYQDVPVDEKVQRVADVFHSVARKYDVMNDLMSLGIHRWWKQVTMEHTGVRYGNTVLDLAGGTGDLAAKLCTRVGPDGLVVLSDINASMLAAGRDKMLDKGLTATINYTQANAECLPFDDNCFHCITIAFGLRNVTDKQAALASMYRVLKPGGRLLILEFSKPVLPLLSNVYDAYSFAALPALGKLIANDADSYRYLAESIRMHPDQPTLQGMLQEVGYERCEYFNMTGGIVALQKGFKF